VRQLRFRALVTFDAITRDGPARRSRTGLCTLMVRASRPGQAGGGTSYPVVITRDDGRPLQPGEPAVVTITLICEQAEAPLGAGLRFGLWGDGHLGHGLILRQIFTAPGPS